MKGRRVYGFHTALGLQLAGEGILQILLDTDERATQRELMALNILHSFINLLVDESSDRRRAAAIFVSKLPWIPTSFEHLHPNHALLLVFKHVIPEACGSPVCRMQLASWMKTSETVMDVLAQETADRLDELFEAQDLNPYMEHVILDSLILHTLQQETLTASAVGSPEDFNQSLADLENCVAALQVQNTGKTDKVKGN